MLTLMNSSNIYISQAYGDDGYSGTSPAVSDGGFGPLRTFNQAFYRINSLRASGFNQPLSIKVIGDYCLENTVRFGIDKSDNDRYLIESSTEVAYCDICKEAYLTDEEYDNISNLLDDNCYIDKKKNLIDIPVIKNILGDLFKRKK